MEARDLSDLSIGELPKKMLHNFWLKFEASDQEYKSKMEELKVGAEALSKASWNGQKDSCKLL